MATEEVADAVETVVDSVEEVSKRPLLAFIAVGVLSAGLGGAVTYLTTKNRLKTRYEELAEQEIADARTFYRKERKEGEFSDPEVLAADIPDETVDIVSDERYQSGDNPFAQKPDVEKSPLQGNPATRVVEVEQTEDEVEEPVEEPPQQVTNIVNVFTQHSGGTPLSKEDLDVRGGLGPYIITEEEYGENEPEHDQMSITWYEDDGVLADDRDQPMLEDIVGISNLFRFGVGTSNPHLVHVRNDDKDLDFEIARAHGSFAKLVHDVDPEPELKHSQRRGRRFRDDDG